MVVRTAHIQLVLVHLESVVECRVTARVTAGRFLVTRVRTQRVAGRISKQIYTMVGVAHLEHLTDHAETRDTDGVTFRYAEIQSSTGEDSSAAVRLLTVLRQVAHYHT